MLKINILEKNFPGKHKKLCIVRANSRLYF